MWAHIANPYLHTSPPLSSRHRELQLYVPLLGFHKLPDLLRQGLHPELEPVSLQGPAHCRLHVQLQVLLLLVTHRPVGQILAVGSEEVSTSRKETTLRWSVSSTRGQGNCSCFVSSRQSEALLVTQHYHSCSE